MDEYKPGRAKPAVTAAVAATTGLQRDEESRLDLR
jgi:hypothetical protein